MLLENILMIRLGNYVFGKYRLCVDEYSLTPLDKTTCRLTGVHASLTPEPNHQGPHKSDDCVGNTETPATHANQI